MKRNTPVQRLAALLLVATLLTLSGTIPLLDVMVGDGKAAVEAEHLPGTHGPPHNHLICIQHQASQWVEGRCAPPPVLLATLFLPAFPQAQFPHLPGQVDLPDARAPPAV